MPKQATYLHLLLAAALLLAGCESATTATPLAHQDATDSVGEDVSPPGDADATGATAETLASDTAGADASAELAPVCRAVLSGAVQAVLDCSPGSDNYVSLSHKAGENQLTLAVSVPGAPGQNGLQLAVALTQDGTPKAGTAFAPGGAMDAITVQKYQDGQVVRQWAATHLLSGVPDQGSYAGTVASYKLIGEAAGFATYEAEGSLTATLPVVPGYDPGAEILLDLQFRLRK